MRCFLPGVYKKERRMPLRLQDLPDLCRCFYTLLASQGYRFLMLDTNVFVLMKGVVCYHNLLF